MNQKPDFTKLTSEAGWERRVWEEISPRRVVEPKVEANDAIAKRLKLWTPDGEIDLVMPKDDVGVDSAFGSGWMTSPPATPTTVNVSLPWLPWSAIPHTAYSLAGIDLSISEAHERKEREEAMRRLRFLTRLKAIFSGFQAANWQDASPTPAAEAPKAAPDYTECLTGWRIWDVEHGRLKSTGIVQSVWHPRLAVPATCQGHFSEDCGNSPSATCSCGWYSYKDARFLYDEAVEHIDRGFASWLRSDEGYDLVWGSVYVWGRVVECDNGWRSEFAYPKELWTLNPAHRVLATAYGVPLHVAPAGLMPAK